MNWEFESIRNSLKTFSIRVPVVFVSVFNESTIVSSLDVRDRIVCKEAWCEHPISTVRLCDARQQDTPERNL